MRNSINMQSALGYCPSVRPSVTHGWISRKRLKLRLCSVYQT